MLSGLGEHDLAFLTRTAVLDRMTGDLCDALLHRRDSAQRLEAFEAGGMFVVALDRRRAWYRYHGAFRSLLVAELARREPDAVADLNRRAADWYEASAGPSRRFATPRWPAIATAPASWSNAWRCASTTAGGWPRSRNG